VNVKVNVHGDKDRNVTLRRLTEQEVAAERKAQRIAHLKNGVMRRLSTPEAPVERENQLNVERDNTMMKQAVEQEAALAAESNLQQNTHRKKVTLRRLTEKEAAAEREARWGTRRAEQKAAAGHGVVELQKERRGKERPTDIPSGVNPVNGLPLPRIRREDPTYFAKSVNMRRGRGYTSVERPPSERRKYEAALQHRQRKVFMNDSEGDELGTDDDIKTASLKDLFKVSATPSLPVSAIKVEIWRALTKTFFDCYDITGRFHYSTVDGEINIEVVIVKIPLVSLHGIQFKWAAGTKEGFMAKRKEDYKRMVSCVLELLQV
jgi:hypothetical protein